MAERMNKNKDKYPEGNYFEEMNIDPKDPKKADRDRFVLSKGHTAPGYYSALAERGFFPKEDLKTLRHLGSY